MSNNYKTHGLSLAKQQFFEDLRKDKDFLEYKKESNKNGYAYSYGTVVAGINVFLLNTIGPASQTIVCRFLRKQRK